MDLGVVDSTQSIVRRRLHSVKAELVNSEQPTDTYESKSSDLQKFTKAYELESVDLQKLVNMYELEPSEESVDTSEPLDIHV